MRKPKTDTNTVRCPHCKAENPRPGPGPGTRSLVCDACGLAFELEFCMSHHFGLEVRRNLDLGILKIPAAGTGSGPMSRLDIIVSPYLECDEFFRKPRSKRKRIIKKWRARAENWRPIQHAFLVGGKTLVVNPRQYQAMRKEMF